MSYVVHLLLTIFHFSGLHQYHLQGIFGILLNEAFHMSLRTPCMVYGILGSQFILQQVHISIQTRYQGRDLQPGHPGARAKGGKSMPRDTALQPCILSLLDMQVTFLI